MQEEMDTASNSSSTIKSDKHACMDESFLMALLHVFQLRSTFFSQTVLAPRTQFEKKWWSCEST